MLMSERTRANGKHPQGPGGRNCTCCGLAPKGTRKARRAVKRAERNGWKRDARAEA